MLPGQVPLFLEMGLEKRGSLAPGDNQQRKRSHLSSADQNDPRWSKGLSTQENVNKNLLKFQGAP